MFHKKKVIFTNIFCVTTIFFAAVVVAKEYSRETAVVRAVRQVAPAVVNISSEYEVRKRTSPFSGFGINPFFESFFKDFFEPGFERHYKRSSLGSGVIIDGKRGFILTNAHVLEKTGKITIVLKDEREFEAQIVGADPDSDLAVLRIDARSSLPAIEMGNSDDLMIGETVIAIGNPFGFSNTVTTGVISALNRSIRTDERVFQDFIQTDASINPGNSGGPLLNINGDLVGINTAIYAKAQGIGFAIPINKARRIVSDLIRYGEVIQAWIGITVQNIDEELAKYLNITNRKGVLIKAVDKKSPARNAGIRDGDIILSMGKRKIQSVLDFQVAMKDYTAGDNLNIQVQRNQKELTVSVKATEFPLALADELAKDLLGLKVDNLPRNKRKTNQTPSAQGVVITKIEQQSYLFSIGVRPGDIIRQIDDVVIKDTNDFNKAVIKYRQKSLVVMLLQREGQLYYITIRL
ncbi:Do family serine endopeptidase [Thermodesulfobacteriota bacterium]